MTDIVSYTINNTKEYIKIKHNKSRNEMSFHIHPFISTYYNQLEINNIYR